MGLRLHPSIPPPLRRPLRQQPQPPTTLLPVPSNSQTATPRHTTSLHKFTTSPRHRPPPKRHPLRRRQLELPQPRRLGRRLGNLVQRHGSNPVHLLPTSRRHRPKPHQLRNHLRPRTHSNVPTKSKQRLRSNLGTRRQQHPNLLPRTLPRKRTPKLPLQLHPRQHQSPTPKPRPKRTSLPRSNKSRATNTSLRASPRPLPRLQPTRSPQSPIHPRPPKNDPKNPHTILPMRQSLARLPRSPKLPPMQKPPNQIRKTATKSQNQRNQVRKTAKASQNQPNQVRKTAKAGRNQPNPTITPKRSQHQ